MSQIGIISVLYDRLMQAFNFNNPVQPKKTVVVVGYGWGGRAFCNNIDTKKYNVTVVSKTEYMLNTTQLKNSLENKNDKLTLFNKNNKINFIKEECTDIDKEQKTIKTNKEAIKFDYLVVAVGSEVNDFGVPGVKDKCYFLKSMDDLNSLRQAIEKNEYKNGKPTYSKNDVDVVILGGGPTGIELAFEMSKQFKNIRIIEAMPQILPMFSKETSETVMEQLNNGNIQLKLNNQVTKIVNDGIYVKNKDKGIDTSYHFDIAIWTCGVKPNPFIKKLTNDKLVVDKNFKFSNNIFAIGDIVASKELGPPTGQNAKNQGKYLAKYFNNDFKGEDYKYEEIGKILHTKEYVLLETKFGTFKLPNLVNPLIDYKIQN
jgi:NADH:ubiquinone reductase (non-electrogenic)